MLNLSLEEQERAAYISGDTARADLLGRLIDAEGSGDTARADLLGRLIDAEAAVSDRDELLVKTEELDDKIQELQDKTADARAALA